MSINSSDKMSKLIATNHKDTLKQLWHFILHLRWHYQLFILSGGFLLGGFISTEVHFRLFLIQFLNVHLLLFGGATAYNSYWDKDEGPIGGLKKPPRMNSWMRWAALGFQFVGLMVALPMGILYVCVYGMSMLFFWLYSSPLTRWKGTPVKSLIAIGISTGSNAVFLGYLAAGNDPISLPVAIAAVGVSCMLLSLYPLSQIYQREEDQNRGDQTFAVTYGIGGVKRFFDAAFFPGAALVSLAIFFNYYNLGVIFGLLGLSTGFVVHFKLEKLSGSKEDYFLVMRVKYATSLAFLIFLVAVLVLENSGLNRISLVADLLLR